MKDPVVDPCVAELAQIILVETMLGSLGQNVLTHYSYYTVDSYKPTTFDYNTISCNR